MTKHRRPHWGLVGAAAMITACGSSDQAPSPPPGGGGSGTGGAAAAGSLGASGKGGSALSGNGGSGAGGGAAGKGGASGGAGQSGVGGAAGKSAAGGGAGQAGSSGVSGASGGGAGGGTGGVSAGTAGASAGTAGASAGTAGASAGTAGASAGTAGASAGTAGASAGTAGAGGASAGTGGAGGIAAGGAAGSSAAGAGGSNATFALTFPDWTLSPGQEATNCVILDLGNGAPVHIGELHNVIAPGVLDLVVYRSLASSPTATPFSCAPLAGVADGKSGTPLMLTRRADDDLVMPPGVGFSMSAHQLVRLEVHAINQTASPLIVKTTSTFVTLSDAAFQHEAGFFALQDTQVSLPPQTPTTGQRAFFGAAPLATAHMFRLEGYTRLLGSQVTLATALTSSDPGTAIYNPTWDWSSPAVVTADPPLQIPAGSGLALQCAWNNTTSNTVSWGTSLFSETCAALIWYWPAVSASECIGPGGGELCCPGGAGCP